MNMWLFYFSSAEAAAAAQLTGVISYRRRKQADISHDLTTPFFCVNTQTHTHAQSYTHTAPACFLDSVLVKRKAFEHTAASLLTAE